MSEGLIDEKPTCANAPYANDLGVTVCACCGRKLPEEMPKAKSMAQQCADIRAEIGGYL